jgi:hypothetical protein
VSLVGRTIAGLEQQDEYTWLLRLDDGTAVEFAARGWDVDETSVTHLTPEVLRQREVDAETARREREEEIRRNLEEGRRRREHIARMRAQLDPEAFERWRRETYPTFAEILKDVWTRPRIAEALSAPSSLLDGVKKGDGDASG